MGTSVDERGRITIQRDNCRELAIQPKEAGILAPSVRTPSEPLDIDTVVGRSIAEEWQEYLANEAQQAAQLPSTPVSRRRRR